MVPLAGPGSWEPGTRELMNAAAALACSRSNSALPHGLDLIDGYYDGTGFEEYDYTAKRWPGKWPLIAGHYSPDVFWYRIEGWSIPADKWPSHVREPAAFLRPIGVENIVNEYVAMLEAA